MLLLPLLLMQLLVFFMLFCSFVCSCCVSSAARYRVKRAPSFEQKRGELRNPPEDKARRQGQPRRGKPLRRSGASGTAICVFEAVVLRV